MEMKVNNVVRANEPPTPLTTQECPKYRTCAMALRWCRLPCTVWPLTGMAMVAPQEAVLPCKSAMQSRRNTYDNAKSASRIMLQQSEHSYCDSCHTAVMPSAVWNPHTFYTHVVMKTQGKQLGHDTYAHILLWVQQMVHPEFAA